MSTNMFTGLTEAYVAAAEAFVQAEGRGDQLQLTHIGLDRCRISDTARPPNADILFEGSEIEAIQKLEELRTGVKIMSVTRAVAAHVWAKALAAVEAAPRPDINAIPEGVRAILLEEGRDPAELVISGALTQASFDAEAIKKAARLADVSL